MNRLNRLVVSVLVCTVVLTPQVSEAHVIKPLPATTCTGDWSYPAGARKVVRCLSGFFGADTPVVMAIAQCESQFRWWADNPYSSAGGLFQYLEGTWLSSRAHHLPGNPASRFNGRWASVVAIREMVHRWRDGHQWPYAPWESSRSCWNYAT